MNGMHNGSEVHGGEMLVCVVVEELNAEQKGAFA
jgi:hypothetical protein